MSSSSWPTTFDDTPIITSSPSPSPSPSPSSPQISPSSTSSTSQTTSRSSPTTDSSSTHSFSSTTSGSVASQSTDQSQPASTSTTSDNSSSQEEQNESKTNVGAIAGGVAGGVVALVGFLVLLFLLCRRRRERAQYQPAAAFATDGSSDVAPASRSVITPYPIDMGHTTAQYQNRPVTQSDFLQSGIVASPYSADPPAPQPIYGYHKGQATRGPYYDGGANSSGHNRTDSEPQSSYNGSTTGIYPYGGIATSEVSSSPGPGYSMASHVAVLQGGDREALRRARQAELANQVQAITREMSDLKRRPSLVPPNTGSTNPAIVEMDEMREEMRVMREQLEYLRQQQQSAWAQGLSDEAPPGYSRRESHT
ncbi:hypothetical protein H0H87_003779 [Tephrocybe sp. NHM501043]|nr:hypothetical protein H0H87_003779 [Tephrocybe sp. NHM501043]